MMTRLLPPILLRGALAMVTIGIAAPVPAQQLVIVVRHAERADGGSKSMQAQEDPLLSAAGEARAQRLAEMLADAGVKAIFATEYKRTQDTGKPLAARLGLAVQASKGNDAGALVAKIKAAHAKDVVLVIGHSNTMPAIVKAFGGGAVTMTDEDYSSVFVVVPATGAVTRLRLQ
jgi:broad specificity phosphatase PhoE